jgi:hypothetical protein
MRTPFREAVILCLRDFMCEDKWQTRLTVWWFHSQFTWLHLTLHMFLLLAVYISLTHVNTVSLSLTHDENACNCQWL